MLDRGWLHLRTPSPQEEVAPGRAFFISGGVGDG